MAKKFIAKPPALAYACSLVVLLSTAGVWMHQSVEPMKLPGATQNAAIEEAVDDEPSEGPIEDDAYPPNPGQPYRITAPEVSIRGYVQRVAINRDGEIAAPSNIYVAGWFSASAQPGQPGISIIDGHVHGPSKPGIFNKLSSIGVNAAIQVEDGDGTTRTFRVQRTASVPEDAASAALYQKLPGVSRQLNLITCSGTYDRDSQNYTERFIAYAALEN